MAGGNAHQRAVIGRIEKEVLQVVSQILGGSPLATKEIPWYETGRFWGGFGAFLAIVLTVIAAVEKDIRWLLFVAIPFAGLSWSVICKPLKPSKWHWRKAMLAVLIAMTGIALGGVYVILPRPEIQLASGPPDTTSSPRPKTEAFAVDIEHRIFTVPGPYGTSFWFGTFAFSRCSLEPTGTAIFLRITNLQQHKEMITAYSIDGLPKTPVTHGRMFIILPKGQVGSGFMPHIIDWGAPSGLGAMVHFPVDDADTTKSIPVTGDFLDYKIGEGHYLEPYEPVRGWVFFEYRKDHIEIPAQLTIKITDQFQRTFDYRIPDHVGDPQGDILSRRIVEGPLEDLSRCAVYK